MPTPMDRAIRRGHGAGDDRERSGGDAAGRDEDAGTDGGPGAAGEGVEGSSQAWSRPPSPGVQAASVDVAPRSITMPMTTANDEQEGNVSATTSSTKGRMRAAGLLGFALVRGCPAALQVSGAGDHGDRRASVWTGTVTSARITAKVT
jgi:hypothetical protein